MQSDFGKLMTPSLNTGKKRSEVHVAALASGGLDSSVMLGELSKTFDEVIPTYVRCGLQWESTELAVLRDFVAALRNSRVKPVQVLDVPMSDVYAGHWSTVGGQIPGYNEPDQHWEIPGRNLILLVKTAVWCKLHDVRTIALGSLRTNPFSDATSDFFTHLERAFSTGLGMDLRISRPLEKLHKHEIIELGRKYPLELTLSCASPLGRAHCGQCGKCRERINAFAETDVPDRTQYAQRVST